MIVSMRERARTRERREQQKEQQNAYANLALHIIGEMWPGMDVAIWQRYSLLLTITRQEAKEKHITKLIETATTELPAIPKPTMSALLLLFGEDVSQVVAAEERERNTDPVHESANTTRKLSAEWGIVTEQRAVVRKEEIGG